jgi:hypothetical protein
MSETTARSEGDASAPTPEIARLFREIAANGPRPSAGVKGPAKLLLLAREVPRRRRFMQQYGWSVPTPEAIKGIRDFVGERKLLEVGAGNGLWAYLLSAYGATVTATDDYTWMEHEVAPGKKAVLPSGFSVPMGKYFAVEQAEAVQAVAKYADHQALFLAWPPPDRPMGHRALAAFQGDRFVFVSDRGCTADAAFYQELALRWDLHDAIEIPQWVTIHDEVYLYTRKFRSSPTSGIRRPNPHLTSI